ncbi:unnamed protein product [Ectocarpus sp. CCAP 1310/34]|nr:unnamed protein product [Ectocarpus sp. CCAP 1310/34]
MSESEEERRPRPIGVADGSGEDSGMERTDAAGANNGTEPGLDSTGVAAPEEVTTAKKVSNRPPAFSENHLVKEKGLWQVYKDFPQKCRYKGRGREAEFLRGLMVAYKEWGYQLYPGVAFEDLASRTEKLAGRARTRSLMRELRDTERDRVLEAKFGREAVDDVHSQEAARLAAKESKTAAAEGDRAEEREDEEFAGSRYTMEVDGDGGDEGKSDRQVAAEGSAAAMSEQVRQRIEANRRLALDRLRSKKHEASVAAAAAAALTTEKENDGGAAAMLAANDGSREVEDLEEDLMDVDGGGGPGDGFDDDEAALADMETEQMAARPVAAEASRRKNTVAEPGPAVVSTSPASTLAVESDETAGAVDEELAPPEPSIREDEAMEDTGSRASGANTAAAVVADDAKDPAPVSAAADGVARGGARAAGAGCAGNVDEAPATWAADAAGGGEPDATAGEESGGELPPASEPGTPGPGVGGGQDRDGANDEAASLRTMTAAAAAAAGADGITGGAKVDDAVLGGGDGGGGAPEPVAAKGDEEGASFSSPAKCRSATAAASGLPLSPLGTLFAGTDVSAEGGLAVVREPLGGLFSDENV